MLIQRRLPKRLILAIGLSVAKVSGPWALAVLALYATTRLELLKVPFLPIATIGTAVAFYIGFKNNSAYDRFWEGRKIWGGIVNASRSWATAVLAYVDASEAGDDSDKSPDAADEHRRLVYRHLAWVNALRLQLRRQSRFMAADAHRTVKQRLADHHDHMRNDWDTELAPFLDAQELREVSATVNPATHLLNNQGKRLARLHATQRLDLFHQIELMHLVNELYTLQGQCERIKNTPFPRQYAEFSRWFVRVFLYLLPFGLLNVFADRVDAATSVQDYVLVGLPFLMSAILISWVFTTMEGVGDASEDPFERSMNDVPMNALSRTIERDLRQLLGETEIPEPEPAAGMILY